MDITTFDEATISMEKVDYELIDQIATHNPNLKKLYTRHKKLEKEVEHLEQYARYSSAAAIRHIQLKKEKLRGKEQMMRIVSGFTDQGTSRIAVAR
jgi:uncharacterized protein YdcH (DUF465 family)